MDLRHTTTIGTVLEHLIANGATDLGRVFCQLFELAMQIEREQHLKAGHRTPERQGYANGYKRIDTPVGTVTVQVPKTAGHGDDPFYPQSLERGQRSSRAVAVAEMYIKGVSTRQAEDAGPFCCRGRRQTTVSEWPFLKLVAPSQDRNRHIDNEVRS